MAASLVLVGGAGAFPGGRGVGTGGMRVIAGGVGGFFDACLLGWEGGMALPLSFSSLAVLLAPLEIGHQCLFAALWDVNLHSHALHCHYGRPALASSKAFWCSHLDVWFLFHARCCFSF
jgi:hypothetical protein